MNGIDTGIGSCQAGIRNVHEADLGAEVVLAPQKMQPNGAAGGEVDPRGTRRHFRIREQRAAANLEIRNNTYSRRERLLERKRIHTHAISDILFLKHQKDRHGFDGVFQPAPKKSGAMRRR